MNCVRKTLFLLVAALAPLGNPTAEAAGLGELVILSELGQPFRAEVRLLLGPGEKLDASCFKRVNRVSNDDTPWINNTRLRLAGIVVISVFLLSLLLKVGTTIGDYINKANDTADEKFNDTMNKIPQ